MAIDFRLNVSMKELKVTGFKKDNHIPTIIESQLLDQNNLLSISFETNPLDKVSYIRIYFFLSA